uniref:histidine kinase n=1 Tax=Magnetococcus massalia (strain MO-1) TaxID=451514 RepID=A0A1S7LI84_MAGMO|nr:Putative histidine kinase with one PAS doamin, one PAS 3 domain, one PAS 4 domain, HisKA domain, HATPase c domain and Response reg domain [Candidatus Magnetococcus massalia]
MNIKRKFALAWFGSALLMLLLVASLFIRFVHDEQRVLANQRLLFAEQFLRDELTAYQETLKQQADEIVAIESVAGTIYLINRYEQQKGASALTFDVEKRRLIKELLKHLEHRSGSHLSLYDTEGKPVVWVERIGEVIYAGYRSPTASQEIHKNYFSQKPALAPPSFDPTKIKGWDGREQIHQLQGDAQGSRLLTAAPIQWHTAGSTSTLHSQHAGYLVVSQALNQHFTEQLSLRTRTHVKVMHAPKGLPKEQLFLDLSPQQALLQSHPLDFNHQEEMDVDQHLLDHPTHFIALVNRLRSDGKALLFAFSLEKASFKPAQRAFLEAMIVGGILSAFFLIPLGWFFIQKQLVNPLDALLEGVTHFRQKSLVPKRLSGKYPAEFKRLSEALHDLGQTVVERERSLLTLSTAMEQAPLSIVITDTDGHIEYANPAFEAISGYRLDEVKGKTPRIIKSDETPDETYQELWQTIGQGETWQGEFINRKKDGSLHWQMAYIAPVLNKEGKITQYIGLEEEITVRKNAEAALAESNQRFMTLASVSPVGIFQSDAEGNYRYVNAQWEQITDTPASIIESCGWGENIHPEDRPAIIDRWQITVRGGHHFGEEFRFLRGDGTIRWVMAEAHPTLDQQGNVYGYVGTITDITTRKKMELELGRERALLRSLIDSIPDHIFYKHTDGSYMGCNRAFANFFGQTEQQIIGQQDLTLFSHHQSYRIREQDLAMLESGEPVQLEDWVKDTEGKKVLLNTLKTPFYGPNGEVLGILGISRDLTERKEFERELEKTRDQAEAANHSKSEFLAAMSHEIRTPMNVVIGMSELLRESSLDEKQTYYVHTLQQAGNALLELIDNILDLSKIEAGKMVLNHQPFDLLQLLDSIRDFFKLPCQDKGLTLHHRFPPELRDYWIKGDDGRIRQVLFNLLGNAIKFTELGMVSLVVWVEPHEDDTPSILFEVSDTGLGIPVAQRLRIFDKFTQQDSSVTRRFGGTGLGLAICQRFSEMMGGSVWVESTEGLGSAFYMRLPLELIEADHSGTEIQQPELPQLPQTRHGSKSLADGNSTQQSPDIEASKERKGLTILVVEDSPDNRNLIKAFLASSPHELTLAENGQVALEKIHQSRFDLIFMDMQMPVLDGYNATRAIRRFEEVTGTEPPHYIYALTAHALVGDREKCLEAGCDDYLTKPIKKSKLLEVIASHC